MKNKINFVTSVSNSEIEALTKQIELYKGMLELAKDNVLELEQELSSCYSTIETQSKLLSSIKELLK